MNEQNVYRDMKQPSAYKIRKNSIFNCLFLRKTATLLMCLFFISMSSAQNYIFYLHGKIVEDQGAEAVDTHQGYGAYLYKNILDSLRSANTVVLSEVRQKNTAVKTYAYRVKEQIDSLLKKGVSPEKITVIGASKGALIAMYVSTYTKNSKVNYVFMAACYEGDTNSELDFYGNILSIYEKSDAAGSCQLHTKNSKGIQQYKEIALNTGLKHGFLYKPLPEWLIPAKNWAMGKYN